MQTCGPTGIFLTMNICFIGPLLFPLVKHRALIRGVMNKESMEFINVYFKMYHKNHFPYHVTLILINHIWFPKSRKTEGITQPPDLLPQPSSHSCWLLLHSTSSCLMVRLLLSRTGVKQHYALVEDIIPLANNSKEWSARVPESHSPEILVTTKIPFATQYIFKKSFHFKLNSEPCYLYIGCTGVRFSVQHTDIQHQW